VNPFLVDAEAGLRDFLDSVRRSTRGAGIAMRSREEHTLPRPLWFGLAELGVLGLAAPDGDAGWLAAAYHELGAVLCPGPLAATAMALQLLPAAEAALVRSGELLASVGSDGVYPWGLDAGVLIAMHDDAASLIDASAPRLAMATLAREPWARVDGAPLHAFTGGRRAAGFGDLAVSALVLGASSRLLEMSAEHAAARRQFGRPIGTFQAVAFPLAEAHVALHNAGCLARAAAQALVSGHDARALCAGARTVTDAAAIEVARTAHQVHGATGFTEESPVAAYSTRIRQWTLLPPSGESRRAALLAGLGQQDEQDQQSVDQAVAWSGDTRRMSQ
jgi:alkylation response protein AidB-like acyl-CoA dehydrogenase